MTNNKQLGAEQMFDQAIVYLFNSYREQGLTADASKQKVAEHIQQAHSHYQQRGLLPKNHKIGLSTPQSIVDDMERSVAGFDWNQWKQMSPNQQEMMIKTHLSQFSIKINSLRKLL